MNYFTQESERLTYRKLTEQDIESWTEFFENNDRLAFLGIDLTKDYPTLAAEWIRKQLERYATQGLGHLAIIEKSSGKFIGMAGIIPRELDDSNWYEIAYSFKPVAWGKGYGTEAAMQMKRFGRESKLSQSFISIIDKNNAASIHVAKKNGMEILFDTEYLGMEVFVYGDIHVI